MNIDIASKDERYFYLCELLNNNGYVSRVVSPIEVSLPDVLILPIKREHSETELYEISKKISPKTKVLFGGDEATKKIFQNNLNDYSKNEYFLSDNAYITAEAFLTAWQKTTRSSLRGKKILISGYGRIGKHLSKILSSLGAKIYVYARREETRNEIKGSGYCSVKLDFAKQADAVINTVPAMIFSSELISLIPENTALFELASKTGFEKTDRVNFALGLPGKILSKTASEAIYKAIISFLD